ncbi:hypothetical protein CARUB_v10012590mg [Capsella rubella]|uniref:Uncharacterized protein n=1 Tax=Capsella rubella TaxID=81985 RepID=R0GLV1_9BRAS|nr:hypothetical protein CARUB_v10012590mg [Capsella rubella]
MSRFISGRDYDSAVEDLLSQAKDLYVIEQVAKINCAGFTDDSAPPTNLETRLRRLKSLPVSRPDTVSSPSRKLFSHSKSMASCVDKKNRGNVSSVSSLSNPARNDSCPLDSSVEETQTFSGSKRNTGVNSGGHLGDFLDYGRTGSSSARFSQQDKIWPPTTQLSSSSFVSIDLASPRFEENSQGGLGEGSRRIGSSSSTRASQEGEILTPTTQTLKLLPKENSRISPSSLTSIDLASQSSYLDKGKNKSKSKFLISWFDKLSLARAMGCLHGKPSSKSKKTKELSWEEEFKKAKKRVKEKSKKMKKNSSKCQRRGGLTQ